MQEAFNRLSMFVYRERDLDRSVNTDVGSHHCSTPDVALQIRQNHVHGQEQRDY